MKKNKELKEIERKVAQKNKIKEAFTSMDTFISECDKKIEKLVSNARSAKDEQSRKLAKAGIASALAAKNRAEKMRYSMDTVLTMGEVSQMTADFLGNMGILCKELNDVSKIMDFGKLDKPLSQTTRNFEMQSDRLESIFENISGSFDDMDFQIDTATDSLVESMISDKKDMQWNEVSTEIDARLEKLKNMSKS